jgi:dTDP-4-amino-4,6-dideoxygalactose transaminase
VNKIRVPLAKPSFDKREVEAVRRVLASGQVVQGPEVEAFENAIGRMHRARHCIAVSSGTAALHVCYLALGIGPGDAVFVPSFAWPSAANMAVVVGARPVFVDVLPGTYNIDSADLNLRIQQCIEHKWASPRAVVPVHQFGLAADMDAVLEIAKEYKIAVIEDAACALGATYKGKLVGTFGRMGIFSFHPRKAVTTGEGGAIVTNDDDLVEKCRMWRNHGQVFQNGQRDFQVAGLNYRMTEIQAAIGQVQLEKFPEILKKRREIASQYLKGLADCPGLSLPANNPEHTWQTFMVVLGDNKDRDFVINELAKKEVGSGPGSVAGHCACIYQKTFGYKPKQLPVSKNLDSQGLAIPLYAEVNQNDATDCVRSILRILNLQKIKNNDQT